MLISTVCAAVSAAGLGIALMTAYRRRFLAATRIAAYALLPVGLAMTGVLRWVADLVFKPTVWLGFGVLALSAALFALTRAVERHRGGGTRKERRAAAKEAAAGSGRPAVAPDASQPTLGSGRGASVTGKSRGAAKSDGDDFSDIEAILKKHGI